MASGTAEVSVIPGATLTSRKTGSPSGVMIRSVARQVAQAEHVVHPQRQLGARLGHLGRPPRPGTGTGSRRRCSGRCSRRRPSRAGSPPPGSAGPGPGAAVDHRHGHLGALDELLDHGDRAVGVRADHGRRQLLGAADLAAAQRRPAAGGLDHHREADLVAQRAPPGPGRPARGRSRAGARPARACAMPASATTVVAIDLSKATRQAEPTDPTNGTPSSASTSRSAPSSPASPCSSGNTTASPQLGQPGHQGRVDVGLDHLDAARAQGLADPAAGAQRDVALVGQPAGQHDDGVASRSRPVSAAECRRSASLMPGWLPAPRTGRSGGRPVSRPRTPVPKVS